MYDRVRWEATSFEAVLVQQAQEVEGKRAHGEKRENGARFKGNRQETRYSVRTGCPETTLGKNTTSQGRGENKTKHEKQKSWLSKSPGGNNNSQRKGEIKRYIQ